MLNYRIFEKHFPSKFNKLLAGKWQDPRIVVPRLGNTLQSPAELLQRAHPDLLHQNIQRDRRHQYSLTGSLGDSHVHQPWETLLYSKLKKKEEKEI